MAFSYSFIAGNQVMSAKRGRMKLVQIPGSVESGQVLQDAQMLLEILRCESCQIYHVISYV